MVPNPIAYYKLPPSGPLICLCGDCRWLDFSRKYKKATTYAEADHAWDSCEQCELNQTKETSTHG